MALSQEKQENHCLNQRREHELKRKRKKGKEIEKLKHDDPKVLRLSALE
jgi:hypothetical protein